MVTMKLITAITFTAIHEKCADKILLNACTTPLIRKLSTIRKPSEITRQADSSRFLIN